MVEILSKDARRWVTQKNYLDSQMNLKNYKFSMSVVIKYLESEISCEIEKEEGR